MNPPQHADIATPKSRSVWFDVAFGLVLPVLCFALDPIVFADSPDGVLPAAWKHTAWFILAINTLALASVLFLPDRRGLVSACASPVLLLGAGAALLIGGAILPLAVIGLMIGIGLLGLVPVFTGFVYLRAFCEAVVSRKTGRARWTVLGLTCGLLLAASDYAVDSYRARTLFDPLLKQSCAALVRSRSAENTKLALQVLARFDIYGPIDDNYAPFFHEYGALAPDDPLRNEYHTIYSRLVGRDFQADLALFTEWEHFKGRK
jgi:hypothetical protein